MKIDESWKEVLKEEFEKDLANVEKALHTFWDKHKDTPGIQDLINKNRSRITLP